MMDSGTSGSSPLLVSSRPPSLRYGIVLLSTSLATGLWLLFDQQLVPTPFLLFVAVVALSAWWGGLGPALVAISISTLASLLLYSLPLAPRGFSATQAATHLLVFLLVSLLITLLQVARQRAEQGLVHQALHDPLTGLPNRRLFTDRLQQLVVSGERTGRSFALVLLDLDGFKGVNDSLGHLQGDQVLTQLAQRLRTHARAADTVARLGGDEFALLLPETDEMGAQTMIGKLEQLLVQPFMLTAGAVSVTVSMGLAVYPHHGTSQESLLERADTTMYAHKRRQAPGAAADERRTSSRAS